MYSRYVKVCLCCPQPPWIILAGYVSGALLRSLIVGFLVWLIATLFTGVFMHNLAVTVSILVMTSMVFALAGFINAVFAKTFDDISIIPTFVLQPMTYLGGVFFSVGLLPGDRKSVV